MKNSRYVGSIHTRYKLKLDRYNDDYSADSRVKEVYNRYRSLTVGKWVECYGYWDKLEVNATYKSELEQLEKDIVDLINYVESKYELY